MTMMTTLRCAAAAGLLALTAGVVPSGAQAPSASRLLQLSFANDGSVTLAAQNVTIREILAEWARLCTCYVVNADKLTGAPVDIPLRFDAMPQATVLDSLLRHTAGYALTPRREGYTGPSHFETIYILAASSSGPASSYPAAYTPPPMPAVPMPTAGSPDDEIPAVVPLLPPRDNPDQPAIPDEPVGTAPGQPSRPTMPGSPGIFVPIVPISPMPPTQQPGMVTPQAAPPGGVPNIGRRP
jgi:hypothetical protein